MLRPAYGSPEMSRLRFSQLARDFSRRMRDRSWWARIAKTTSLRTLQVVNVVCAAHIFADKVGWICMVDGPSMLPTMSVSGEVVLENRMVTLDRLARGDLVTFISPLDPTRIVCKRIVGLPGDVICVDPSGMLAPSTEHVIIPRNHVWLSGDNAVHSRDSRIYGPVSMALIKGRLVAKIWPLTQFTMFRNNFTYID